MYFTIPHIRSVSFGIESIRVLEPKLWESILRDIKNEE